MGATDRRLSATARLEQGDEGKWRVEFDEPWAREGAKPPEQTEAAASEDTAAPERTAAA